MRVRRQALAALRPSSPSTILPAAIGVAIVAIGLVGLFRAFRSPRVSDEIPQAVAETPTERVPARHAAVITAARRLNTACGVLAFSVLADSGVEHWRGSFHNRMMFLPLAVSGLTIGVSLHGTADERPAAHLVRDIVYGMAAGTAIVGGGFHVYNVAKRPGGFSWLNLFYGAPIGAPWALLLAGALGLYSERIRDQAAEESLELFGLPAGRTLAVLVSVGLTGTVGEVGLLHFRGAYHNPAMFLPVIAPPIAAALLANAGIGPTDRDRHFTRGALRFTALLGLAGVAFHTYGIQRNMGGWRNWSQNILNGPPLPAPPSFTGLALAGLAALGLMDDHPDA